MAADKEVVDLPYPNGRRGFAGMTEEKRREISAKGGRSPKAGRPFTNRKLAQQAGRKGGIASRGGKGKLPEIP